LTANFWEEGDGEVGEMLMKFVSFPSGFTGLVPLPATDTSVHISRQLYVISVGSVGKNTPVELPTRQARRYSIVQIVYVCLDSAI